MQPPEGEGEGAGAETRDFGEGEPGAESCRKRRSFGRIADPGEMVWAAEGKALAVEGEDPQQHRTLQGCVRAGWGGVQLCPDHRAFRSQEAAA